MSAEVAAVLRDARALIADESQWVKRQMHVCAEAGDRYDINGAVYVAAKGTSLDGLAMLAVHRAMPNGMSANRPAYLFNDDDATTHQMVLDLFDRAIAAQGVLA